MSKKMQFPGPAIVPGSLRNYSLNGAVRGFEFGLRLKYYRGLFLSCADEFSLAVDGRAIADRDIAISLNDKELAPSMLQELVMEFWRVTDVARIAVRYPGGIGAAGAELDLRFFLRSPYLPDFDPSSPNKYVQIDNCEKGRLLPAREESVR
jgi:hypothetical protein